MRKSRRGTNLKWVLQAPVRLSKAGMFWLTKTSEGFERKFQKLSHRASKVSDAATKVDSKFGKRISAFLAPASRIWNSLIRPIRVFVRDSPVVKRLVKATYWLWYPLVAISSFGRTFVQTRSKELLIWTLPFVVVVGGSLLALWILNLGNNSVSQKYRKAIDEAIAKGEFQQAALYQQKLQTLGIGSDLAEMQRIRELAKTGKLTQAIEMAERLTPEDKIGSPDIHFWLAGVYFEEQATLKGQEALDRAIYHISRLEQALQELNIRPENYPANIVMLKAMIEFKKTNIEGGLALLKTVSSRFWPALVLQMETHIKLKKDEEAMQDALALSEAVRMEPQLVNEVSALFFPMWCAALNKAGNREEMKSAVSVWHQKYPDHPQGLSLWAGIQLQEIDALLVRGSDADLARATKMLLDVSAQTKGRTQEIISAWFVSRMPPNGDNRNYLKLAELLAKEPDLQSDLLEMLGTTATMRGEQQLALDFLKRATEKDPNNFIAWNNLAYVANSYFENQVDLALKAAEKAAQLQPENIGILHTRGFIHIKLKQWDLAIEDLRAVVAERPNDSEVHRGLAQAYKAVGKTELASFHEQLAKK